MSLKLEVKPNLSLQLMGRTSPCYLLRNLWCRFRKFHVDSLEFNALLCTLMELIPSLYSNEVSEVVANVPCGGTVGPKGEKFGCGGAAIILHKFEEARKKDVAEHRAEEANRSLGEVVERMMQATCPDVAIKIVRLENLTR